MTRHPAGRLPKDLTRHEAVRVAPLIGDVASPGRSLARAVADDPGWADYQAKTTRTLPVVALERVHDELRAQLGELQAAAASGTAPARDRPLAVHCLAFCDALTRHHTGEDAGVFPALRRGSQSCSRCSTRWPRTTCSSPGSWSVSRRSVADQLGSGSPA